MKTGAELIADERKRQINVEGRDAEHDSQHADHELTKAAICYAEAAIYPMMYTDYDEHPQDWPWECDWWKPSVVAIRNLEKAGALIAAEIDRLQAEAANGGEVKGE